MLKTKKALKFQSNFLPSSAGIYFATQLTDNDLGECVLMSSFLGSKLCSACYIVDTHKVLTEQMNYWSRCGKGQLNNTRPLLSLSVHSFIQHIIIW